MPGPRANIDGRSIDRKSLSEAQVRAIVRDELSGLSSGGAITSLTMMGDVVGQSVGADIQTAIDNGVIELNNFAGSVLTYMLDRANQTGTQLKATISDLPALVAGTYTPALTNVTNVAASVAYASQYMRVGNVVTVTGKVDIDPTAAALTELRISLPVASALVNQEQCAGAGSNLTESARVLADAANDAALLSFTAVAITNQTWSYSFSYLVI